MDPEHYKGFRGTVEAAHKDLNQQVPMLQVFGRRIGRVRAAFDIMVGQMEALAEDKEVKPTTKEKATVQDAVEIFLVVATYEPVRGIFRSLAVRYLNLASNWNREVGFKNRRIGLNIQATLRLIEGQETFSAAAKSLRVLLRRLQDMQNYTPPAFEASRHYLNALHSNEGNNEQEKSGIE